MQINSVKSDARQDVFFSAGIFVHQFSIEVCISWKYAISVKGLPHFTHIPHWINLRSRKQSWYV